MGPDPHQLALLHLDLAHSLHPRPQAEVTLVQGGLDAKEIDTLLGGVHGSDLGDCKCEAPSPASA